MTEALKKRKRERLGPGIKKEVARDREMDKKIIERLEVIEEKVSEMFSLMREIYVPDSKREIHEVFAKHRGDPTAAIKELNMRNRIRYKNGELQS